MSLAVAILQWDARYTTLAAALGEYLPLRSSLRPGYMSHVTHHASRVTL